MKEEKAEDGGGDGDGDGDGDRDGDGGDWPLFLAQSFQMGVPEPAIAASAASLLPSDLLLLPLVPIEPCRSSSSAIRDYPEGCARRGSARSSSSASGAMILMQGHSSSSSSSHGYGSELRSGNQIVGSELELRSNIFVDPYGPSSMALMMTAAASTSSSSSSAAARRMSCDMRLLLDPASLAPRDLILYDPCSAVVNTLRIYDAIRRSLLLDESFKHTRPDLYAGTVLIRCGLSINRSNNNNNYNNNNNNNNNNNITRLVGDFPGVEVGDIFFFRMELCCIGMHGPVQGGIAYIQPKDSPYGSALAFSIIASGGYSDEDSGDVLIYTGQGGRRRGPDGKQTHDQKLERGNLAMECSFRNNVPVRVIRGIKEPNSPSGKAYTYDGLYRIDSAWSEKARSGFREFKFKLVRLPGQPQLGSALINLSNELRSVPHLRQGLRFHDISGGREAFPVCVVNTVDGEEGPEPFHYYSTHVQHSSAQWGPAANCCSCLRKRGNMPPYLSNGLLVRERTIIHECGVSCHCSVHCPNRLTQRPSRFRFEVFKTADNRGWGLRSQDVIPSGSFVCEYVGEVVDETHPLKSRDYYLDLGMIEDRGCPKWGDVSGIIMENYKLVQDDVEEGLRVDFTLDSTEIGNVARFIHHSCTPNLLIQRVLWDHHWIQWPPPHVMLFAMDNIPPFRELTLDYGSPVHHRYHS